MSTVDLRSVQILTVTEAAQHLSRTERQVRRLVHAGKLLSLPRISPKEHILIPARSILDLTGQPADCEDDTLGAVA